MAEVISIGNELKDAYKPVDKWIKNGLNWLGDVESFYNQRALIEREYADKLKNLCQEAYKKKAKVTTVVSVGENPTITPGSLESASLVAWNEIISQTEQIAKERGNLATEFERKIAGGISDMNTKYEGIRTKWKQFHDELVTTRDKYYDELNKSKKDYDATCQAMENQRSKSEKHSNDRVKHKQEKREFEMNVAKNNYLIKINISNRLKDKFYYQDLPEILDGLQNLNESKVSKLNSFWLLSNEFERAICEKTVGFTKIEDSVIKQNLPKLDTAMFVKHNLNEWKEPEDFYYIPSSIWHDDEEMITEGQELEDLKNKLDFANSNYNKYERLCEDEKQKLEETIQNKNALMGSVFNEVQIKSREDYHKFEEMLVRTITWLQKFTSDDTRRVSYEVEMQTIESAAKGKDLAIRTQTEKKKKSTFGFLKKSSHKSSSVTNGGGDASINGDYDGSDVESFVSNKTRATSHSVKSRLFGSVRKNSIASSTTTSNGPIARVLYAYNAQGDDETSIALGEQLSVLELDDGSGWTKVAGSSSDGLVPTSYLQIENTNNNTSESSSNTPKKQPPKVAAPRKGAKKVKYMEILYNYEPQGDDELGVAVGDKILVITEDDGSGWTEGEIEGIRGLFPTSYGRML